MRGRGRRGGEGGQCRTRLAGVGDMANLVRRWESAEKVRTETYYTAREGQHLERNSRVFKGRDPSRINRVFNRQDSEGVNAGFLKDRT